MNLDQFPDLSALALACGLQLSYVDGRGTQRDATVEQILATLNAMGDVGALTSPADATDARRAFRDRLHSELLEPVYVVDEGVATQVVVRFLRRPSSFAVRVEFEFGGESTWMVTSDELEAHVDEHGEKCWRLALPAMPVGYHQLCVVVGKHTGWSTVIVRPLRGAVGRFTRDWRAYAVQAPMFSLHSARSWGSGDVGDFDDFARIVANHGATVVSTLPLLASFGPADFESSPYRPVSRRFWNDRWIALDQVGDLNHSPAAQYLINEMYDASTRASWVHDGMVDGAASFTAKRNVLQAWVATESEFMTRHESSLRNFVTHHPEVNDYARFRAASEHFGRDISTWPATARSGLLRWNDVDPTIVRYHLFAQWIIDGQMRELAQRLAQRGQSLQLDIPVGVHPHGYDVWKNPEEFVTSMSIGAPPDDLTTDGQTWGAPPPHPRTSRKRAHHQFREALRAHMEVAGVVRIDHVMGLQRLFWVPEGSSAADGVYVSMPFHELLAIVAIEAQRHGVDVVGEDLGTVDHELRNAMEHEGLRRTYVAQFAIEEHGLGAVPAGAVASFATHDTATFWGWWQGSDIDERVSVGQMTSQDAANAHGHRLAQRKHLVHVLGLAADATPEQVFDAVHQRLAESEAGLVMVQVEDLLKEPRAVNLPGTSLERANWAQRTSLSLEEMGATTALGDALHVLRQHRGFATGGGGATTASSVTLFSDEDLHLFNEGRHFRLHHHLGAHTMIAEGVEGCYFAVWAPNAERVAVVGDWNGWDGSRHPLVPLGSSGIWEGFIPGATSAMAYKYRIRSRLGGHEFDKADPMATWYEEPSKTASRIFDSNYQWRDDDWTAQRSQATPQTDPVSVYEVHLGSWRRVPEDGNRSLTYRELAEQLPAYCVEMGFTHVQFLPIMEHPFYGSWGYQTTGYFAPSSRWGTPDDLRYLIDELHQAGVGVLLDWVPSHFPSDEHALALFDGTHLYEHADERQRVHPDWQSWTFNYSRNEVRSFLISSACFWLEQFHADGLRLDAVASMLYLDYSRKPGEWVPNQYGGREDLTAVDFLRQCNAEALTSFPGIMMIAEESTSWPAVTRRPEDGGLGFLFKWDMGWMHDTLGYFERDPIYRQHHQHELTFRAIYAGHEHFMLPLSHDEVVHGKGSLVAKMPGDPWQARANLRALLGYQYMVPGKKLLFMGAELAQWREWSHESSLDWHLSDDPSHQGVQAWVRELNTLYRTSPALHRDDASWADFDWLSCDDAAQSVLVWRRGEGDDALVVVVNLTPVPRPHYGVPVTASGAWRVLLNADETRFGGSGYEVPTLVDASDNGFGGNVAVMSLPPLSMLILRRDLG